ncbi:MAG: hypothetical protein ACPGQL_04320 [Thermoplasmatota archaeon]
MATRRSLLHLSAAALLAVALAGCTVDDEGTYTISGAFTQSRTAGDLMDFHETVSPYSDDVAIMESFPEQFVIHVDGRDRCDELHDLLSAKRYLGRLGACEAQVA